MSQINMKAFQQLSKISDVTTGVHLFSTFVYHCLGCEYDHIIDYEMFYGINENFTWERSLRTVDVIFFNFTYPY